MYTNYTHILMELDEYTLLFILLVKEKKCLTVRLLLCSYLPTSSPSANFRRLNYCFLPQSIDSPHRDLEIGKLTLKRGLYPFIAKNNLRQAQTYVFRNAIADVLDEIVVSAKFVYCHRA